MLAAKNKVIENATVHTWEDAYTMMRQVGFAVVDNWTELLSVESQSMYVLFFRLLSCHEENVIPFFYCLTVPEDCKETIFEGVVCSDCSSFTDAHYDKISLLARQQMKQVQPGGRHAKWKAFKERYGQQTVEIIEGFTQYDRPSSANPNQRAAKRTCRTRTSQGTSSDTAESGKEAPAPNILKKMPGMFKGKPGLVSNWKTGFTSLVNGTGYQHPRSDAGRPDSYKGLKMLPFGTIHGFGLNEFSMWLLPDPFSNSNKYGFLHTFKASQMLFMRGDFVHAGVPSPIPRGHMKFFPMNDAGWNQVTRTGGNGRV